VGLAVGLVVVIGSLIADDIDVVTVALAIILGVGHVLYGLSVTVAALVHRRPGSGYPVAAMALAAGTIIVGVLLVLQANEDIDALRSTFAWLGVGLLLLGLGLVGWAVYLRSQDRTEPTD
jgi:hypothetical protein